MIAMTGEKEKISDVVVVITVMTMMPQMTVIVDMATIIADRTTCTGHGKTGWVCLASFLKPVPCLRAEEPPQETPGTKHIYPVPDPGFTKENTYTNPIS